VDQKPWKKEEVLGRQKSRPWALAWVETTEELTVGQGSLCVGQRGADVGD
jgi:hypothetical protein